MLLRHHSYHAYAPTAIWMAAVGQLPRLASLAAELVEDAIDDTDHPERADDDRHEQMARRLLNAVRTAGRFKTEDIVDQVTRRGPSWLLGDAVGRWSC